jgi:hypothetical protein
MFVIYTCLTVFLLMIFLYKIDRKFIKTRIIMKTRVDGGKQYYAQRRYLFFFWYDIDNTWYINIDDARLVIMWHLRSKMIAKNSKIVKTEILE